MDLGCRLCGVQREHWSPSPWNQVLWESVNFLAMPTLGAIVEGWLLVVPRAHYLCAGALPPDLLVELDQFLRFVADRVEQEYGPAAIFEHGPSCVGEAVGCTVDHAHMHIVPTRDDLIEGARGIAPKTLQWRRAVGLADARDLHLRRLPYLYVEQPRGNAHIATGSNIPSQLFRRVVAHFMGAPEHYDWRQFPETRNVEATIEKLGGSSEVSMRSDVA